jgi:predicted ABC-type exoprotein transport system permease subunit
VSEDVRGPLARAGIAALNVLLPGLGLLRLGFRQQALAFMAAPLLVLLLVLIFYALTPRLAFAGWAGAMALAVLAMLVIWAWSIALSWRRSRMRDEALPWWRRWYALVLWIAAGVLAAEAVRPILHAFYKPFYLPAESMGVELLPVERVRGRALFHTFGPSGRMGEALGR